ncbi:SusC/RagA family TonB-linked outer membrane protein [Mucilaginibacter sp. KACC 22063]|uniref:SusC/RagA family TonB-linked outer membrane protein n=1 Tax=Mucilaginibacter sp. KACC 22063 TaxID=3025666 RepID=UPI002366B668|nr:TonB-dependent receptor [Mucilaginibacter sp. KACC 22063]WDF57419.1 TonB-dependent receptor [Mucilaginibacter sp. KACC 22063]
MRKLIYLLLLFSFTIISGLWQPAFAQGSFTLKGRVLDSKGNTLPGATVKVEGTTQGVMADASGSFSITLKAPSTLVVSFTGMATRSVSVTSATKTIDVTLSDNGRNLNEVVVVGYGTQKRADITGSVTTVPKARLSQLPVTNVLQALEGAVAGVNITTTSSVPGSQPTTLLRGQNSINASSSPFVVVDGIPLSKTGGSLNDINPNDIASMEILKDASAAAIYGTNASNGVILITTKRGTTGKAVIRYTGYGGFENLAHVLEPRDPASFTQKYLDYLSQNNLKQQFTEPVYNSGERANYAAGRTVDWMKEVTQQGYMQDHNLSVSGGTPDVKYYVSGDYLKQKGVVKGYQYNRVSIRSNLDINVTNYLTVGTSAFITNNNYDGGRANLLFATAMSPYGSVYNTDGTYMIYPQAPEQLYTNPLLGLTTSVINRSVNLVGNGYGEIKFGGFLKGLRYRLNVGYNYLPTRYNSYSGRLANTPLGSATARNEETRSYTIDNLLYYTKDIGKHHIDITGLYGAQQRNYFVSGLTGTGFINDELTFNQIGVASTVSGASVNGSFSGSYADRYALNYQMGRAVYSYDQRYVITVTGRRDGSSVFGANTSKYGFFPSAALAWNISNESFLQNSKIVNNLKLRGSYGSAGNEAISVYQTITTDGTVRFPFNGVSNVGVQASNLGNANLHWESTKQANIGVDFSVLKNRISGTIDAYNSNTSGLLLKRSLPAITGYANVWDNLGKTNNKGLEVTLTTRNIQGDDFRWESNIVYATNKNKIVDLYGDKQSDLGNRWFIGQPISVIYDYKMVGVWQKGEDPSKQDPTAKPGDLKFADLNGDGKITPDDRTVLGQTTPKWTGGLTNTFHYKALSLSVFIQTAQGALRNNADYNYADEAGRRNTPAEIGYWTPTNGSQEFQSLSYTNTRGYGYPHDASYTRLKDITLSYNLPTSLISKWGISSLNVYASGRNLKTWTNWIGWDPEQTYYTRGSGDYVNNYPLTRTIVLGLNVSLK